MSTLDTSKPLLLTFALMGCGLGNPEIVIAPDIPQTVTDASEDVRETSTDRTDVERPAPDSGLDVPDAGLDVYVVDASNDVGNPVDARVRWTRPSLMTYLTFDTDSDAMIFTSHTTPPTVFGTLLGGTYLPDFAAQGLQISNPGEGIFANDSNVGNFGTQDFGIAAWVRLENQDAGTGNRTIAAKRGAFAFRINTAGNPIFGDSFSTCSVISPTGITDSDRHFVAFTRIAGIGTLYLGLNVLAAAPCATNLASGNALYIFASESGSSTNLPLGGTGDEVVIWPGNDILGLYCSSIENAQRAGSSVMTPAECVISPK